MVYAKCSEVERLQLWDSLYFLASNMTCPWLIGGDFNVILNEEEKIGGLPGVLALGGMVGLPMTKFSRGWIGLYIMNHSRIGLDILKWNICQGLVLIMHHYLYLVEIKWIILSNHSDFLNSGWSMILFLTLLRSNGKQTYLQLVIREDIVKIKEHLFEENPSKENRMVMQRAQAELKLYLHYEEEFWRQKAGMDYGNWLEDADRVAGEAVNFFHKQFTHEEVSKDSPILNHIPELIREEDNMLLAEQPTIEKVHKAVFELNGDSTCGPDGFSRIFYQKCWEVIKADVFSVVKAFFDAQTLPKSITQTNLVLLPKKNVVESFSDMRPISLSNFINKVISRVVHDRLDKLLSRVISPNQSGFVKGRNIIENAHGFFHSTRGVKQGDPLSLTLFIIDAEVLSRALNSLFDQPDDTIIFSAADNYSLQMIMDTLQEYEKISGQLVNKRKSSFYMFSKVSNELSQQVAAVTGFMRGQFPFTYLGVPITHARKRKVDYTELLKKVKDRWDINKLMQLFPKDIVQHIT
ncbi:uncharacterized protein LOC132628715 [Lycium barbarum]|uniref:uncharacterized protein LOC132628715 n=1 Tax=Lycium barbarum TaxID=112863 RepID=UPI00293EDA85|nr:uncharacterized protein LOC132628715 [Lycium barbarum]